MVRYRSVITVESVKWFVFAEQLRMCESAWFSQPPSRLGRSVGINIACQPTNPHQSSPLMCKGPGENLKFTPGVKSTKLLEVDTEQVHGTYTHVVMQELVLIRNLTHTSITKF